MNHKGIKIIIAAVLVCSVLAVCETCGALEWSRQLGTEQSDIGLGISVDGQGHVYVVGYSRGDLTGENPGSSGPFIGKYDSAGNLLWVRQYGNQVIVDIMTIDAISIDALGNIFIAGQKAGSLPLFIAKCDTEGNVQWWREATNRGWSNISTDGEGNAYVAGHYYSSNIGTFPQIYKFDSEGNIIINISGRFFFWPGILELPRPFHIRSLDICADGTRGVYLVGETRSPLEREVQGGLDGFLAKIDMVGELEWILQIGTSEFDLIRNVGVDGQGDVYISGFTRGNLVGLPGIEEGTGFIGKYDAQGNQLWIQHVDLGSYSEINDMSVDEAGNIYVTGALSGFIGETTESFSDVFVAKYNSQGALLWCRELITSSWEDVAGVSADNVGNVFITGRTTGGLDGPSAGGLDVLVAKMIGEVTICGTIELQDWVGPNWDGCVEGIEVTIEIRNPGDTYAIETHVVSLESDGSYWFETPLAGIYDIAAKGPSWLRQVQGSIDTSEGAMVDFSLLNGDINGDNEINFDDLDMLLAAFWSIQGDPNYDDRADLDGNGEVDFEDFNTMLGNFYVIGDE